MKHSKAKTHNALIAAIGCSLVLSVALVSAPADASSVGRVSVIEVDEVRDAATIARAKARNRSENSESDSGGSFSSGGCSDLNIGNVKTGIGQRAPRNVTVVIEGPVIQENNCR